MGIKYFTGIAAAAAFACAGAAHADTTVYNSTPTDGWYYGGGNDYTPANTLVLATDAGDELYLRAHKTFDVAPASNGDVYSFTLGTDPMSFDWGFDTLASGVSARITLTNIGTGDKFSYNALFVGNDNELQNGSTQNSFRLNWAPINFDANVDGLYRVSLAVNGLSGGQKQASIRVQVREGVEGGVPEPATWALMIMGFGGAGAALRRRRTAAAL
jgi:hypothetical protein